MENVTIKPAELLDQMNVLAQTIDNGFKMLLTHIKTSEVSDEIIEAEEVAALLRIPIESCGYYTAKGIIPSTKVGKHRRYSKARVLKWFAENEDMQELLRKGMGIKASKRTISKTRGQSNQHK